VIYLCVDGKVEFSTGQNKEDLQMGETLLVPASMKDFVIESSEHSELLEVYIK
jgi:mannose-6-phosphate isomerase